jgi:hypothetical protein
MPCGTGKITDVCISFDNPWSACENFKEMKCPKCEAEWRIFGNFLEEIIPPDPNAKRIRDPYTIQLEVAKIGRQIVDSHFLGKFDPKAEYAVLKTAGICSLGPIGYKRKRTSGASPSRLCGDFHRNTHWLKTHCTDPELTKTLEILVDEEAPRPVPPLRKTIRIDSLPK